jgi:hypothetical protein
LLQGITVSQRVTAHLTTNFVVVTDVELMWTEFYVIILSSHFMVYNHQLVHNH